MRAADTRRTPSLREVPAEVKKLKSGISPGSGFSSYRAQVPLPPEQPLGSPPIG